MSVTVIIRLEMAAAAASKHNVGDGNMISLF